MLVRVRIIDSQVVPAVSLVCSCGMVGRPCPPSPWSPPQRRFGSTRVDVHLPCEKKLHVPWFRMGCIFRSPGSDAFPFPRTGWKGDRRERPPLSDPNRSSLCLVDRHHQPYRPREGNEGHHRHVQRNQKGGGGRRRWPRAWWKKRR